MENKTKFVFSFSFLMCVNETGQSVHQFNEFAYENMIFWMVKRRHKRDLLAGTYI